jgi:shikimate dehydrogenase
MRQYGLIGYPLTHSFSQKYFTEKFLQEGINDAEFLNFPIATINEVERIFSGYPQLQGLSVTIPHKKTIIAYLDDVSDIVKETGACNCIKIKSEKKTGFNTDIVGFEKSFVKKLKPHHTKALILGTGGAGGAVEYVLKKLHIRCSFVSRTGGENKFTYQQINKTLLQEFTIIINCTPLGTFPNISQAPSISYEFLTPKHYVFDLVYNPPLTEFLQRAQQQGCTIQNGYEMLVIQAEENWKIWND